MLTNTELKAIMDQSFAIPAGSSPQQLAPQLLANLGSPDSDRRETSLEIIWEWINNGCYTPTELKGMAGQLCDNLQMGLGEQGDDRVFLRAFSALILGAVIRHEQHCAETGKPFLTAQEVAGWREQSLAGLLAERDLRGYVFEKGWAHALAHGADLLGDLARSRHTDRAGLEAILNTVAARVTCPAESVFLFEEDQRLATAVYTVLLRGEVELGFFEAWLAGLLAPAGLSPWQESYSQPELNHARVNTLGFLRALYFHLLFGVRNFWQEGYYDREPQHQPELLAGVQRAVRSFNRGRFYREAAGAGLVELK